MEGREIITLILNDLKIKAPTFAKSVGLKYQRILDIQSGKTQKISTAVADAIIEKYPQYNRSWLLTGEGEMLKGAEPQRETEERTVKSYTKGVPYYNVDFLGGFDLLFDDSSIVPEYLIDFRDFNRATCWCNITGHSMEPEINHGDIIALREIADFSFIPYGEIYAIVTTTGMRTVKRIGPSSAPDCYSLIPTNKSPEYGIQEIPKASILRLYEVLGCMKKI